MAVTTWQEVVIQALNVAQTVLLAYLTAQTRAHGLALDDIRTRSRRIRRTDRGTKEPPT